jgi:hypothetical protein
MPERALICLLVDSSVGAPSAEGVVPAFMVMAGSSVPRLTSVLLPQGGAAIGRGAPVGAAGQCLAPKSGERLR